MSHELEVINGKASMMYVGETPWHGLGTKLDNPATALEAIAAANLDYEVEKRPIHFDAVDGPTEVPDKFATVRTDTEQPLGVVGKRYTVLQNKNAFTFFDDIVGEGKAIYHTAGVLFDGARIWIMAKLPERIVVTDDDEVEQYLILSNTHDGTGSVTAMLSPIRVVCNNSLSLALNNSHKKVKIRHTTNIMAGFKNAAELLGVVGNRYEEIGNMYRGLTKKDLDSRKFNDYIEKVFPSKNEDVSTRTENIRGDIRRLFDGEGRGLNIIGTKGTAWTAYNAVVEWVDFYSPIRGDLEKRLNSMWFGSKMKLKEKALSFALEV